MRFVNKKTNDVMAKNDRLAIPMSAADRWKPARTSQ
jgi:hypothetical protein